MKRLSRKKTRDQDSSVPYYTLIIIGDNKVGKTQLLHRLNGEEFQRDYFPTFGVDFRIKTLNNDKGKYKNDIQIIDFPGEKDEMHKNLINDFINSTNAFLVVFDISDEYSVSKAIDIKKAVLKEFDASGIEYSINGDPKFCVDTTISVSLKGVSSEALMISTKQFCGVSNGSACTSKSYTPSYVLVAMGLDNDTIESSLRISWGAGTPS